MEDASIEACEVATLGSFGHTLDQLVEGWGLIEEAFLEIAPDLGTLIYNGADFSVTGPVSCVFERVR